VCAPANMLLYGCVFTHIDTYIISLVSIGLLAK